ncbi:hypothetical protein Tco_1014695 [Tanacetum coccineum]
MRMLSNNTVYSIVSPCMCDSAALSVWPAILIRPGEPIPFGRPYRTHLNGPRSPSDSLSNTSSVHSSGFDASGQTHSGPSTRVASSRLVYPPIMTPRYSEAFRRWRSAPLSTPYPPTISPTTSVPSSTPVLRLIAPTLADILPPRKRFRDSYSPEDSREDHMKIGTANAEAVADLSIGDGVGAHIEYGIGMGVKIAASDTRKDEEEFETA